ncbi:aspartate kinase [Christiangramia portivictoriae]|uniref:aspartate kinase n=1 Tax=Christiangramia portivictoriae TaxID=326069 RepID=UPI00047E60A0|nr:aspartate kinase [Christiangramia portivictoriae]
MKVLKFGGTSVGSAENIRNVSDIIQNIDGEKLLVLSAMSGVTNLLVELSGHIQQQNQPMIDEVLEALFSRHENEIELLFPSVEDRKYMFDMLQAELSELRHMADQIYSSETESSILTAGETILTKMFSFYLSTEHIENRWLNARDFMQVSNLENPNTERVGKLLQDQIESQDRAPIYVTQGFVRINDRGEISTLNRGGSDFTATIIGAAINASEVQIWTDINGLHNNDPRIVENTFPVAQLSFEEAAELAYFGAKILHPQTISPVIEKNIPVFLKNTFKPTDPGTCISAISEIKGLKAISAKDNITAIKIKSNRMLMAHGFLRKIFEVFDKYETAIDMITTSEIAISLTIDNITNLEPILGELQAYGEISVDRDHSIICVVGEGLIDDRGTPRLFEILDDVPVRMISYGGSNNNISLLVDTKYKAAALQNLNKKLFRRAFEASV